MLRDEHHISTGQYRRLLSCVREVTRVAGVDDFHAHVVKSVRGLLDDAWVQSETYEPETMTFLAGAAWPIPPEDVYEEFKGRAQENPILAVFKGATGALGPWTWRTVLSSDQAHETLPIYHDVYKRIEIGNQAAICSIEPDGKMLMQGFSREGEYRKEDLAVIRLFRPYLNQAYQTWVCLQEARAEPAWLEDGLEALGAGLVLLDGMGRVERWTPLAVELLNVYVSPTRRERGRLPRRLEQWVQEAISPGPDGFVPPIMITLPSTRGQHELAVRLTRAPRHAGYLLVLEERRVEFSADELAIQFGLPRRRAQVFALMTQGMSNMQIADALTLSPRTVAKHVELLLRDLG